MAVPSSGALKLRGIRREIGNNNYDSTSTYSNISLRQMSIGSNGEINTANASTDRPNSSAPYAMSEFYSYDHDKTTTKAFTANGSPNNTQVCGNTPNTTYYHNGSGTNPTIGDTIYTNSSGATEAGAGFLALSTTTGIQINSSSVVSATYTCSEKKK
jgi:hypothetical protein